MRKIPIKNYFIYLAICFITLFLLMYFVQRVGRMDMLKSSALSGVLFEIADEDVFLNLKSYSLENSDFFLYISHEPESSFEESFKDYINARGLKEDIIYLNGWNKLDKDFVGQFKKEMFAVQLKNVSLKALTQSNLYYFKNGKVVSLLYDEVRDINMNDVNSYIESFGEIESD